MRDNFFYMSETPYIKILLFHCMYHVPTFETEILVPCTEREKNVQISNSIFNQSDNSEVQFSKNMGALEV